MNPLSPVQREDAMAMWHEYAAGRTGSVPPEEDPVVEQFGDHRALADEPLPRVGGHWIACDGAGVPRCVLRSTELRLGRLSSVDDAFAWDEGENDRTRDTWLAGHRAYFTRTQEARGNAWSDDLEVVFERFRVVWPPEVADPS